MKTSEMIEWRFSGGGSMGGHHDLMINHDYVGHFYADPSLGINVAQVMEDIEVRYNSHDKLVAALERARDYIDRCGAQGGAQAAIDDIEAAIANAQ